MFGRRTDERTNEEDSSKKGDQAAGRVDNAEVRVMDRLPHPTDRIDETLIRVEWPDPTGKYTRPGCASR